MFRWSTQKKIQPSNEHKLAEINLLYNTAQISTATALAALKNARTAAASPQTLAICLKHYKQKQNTEDAFLVAKISVEEALAAQSILGAYEMAANIVSTVSADTDRLDNAAVNLELFRDQYADFAPPQIAVDELQTQSEIDTILGIQHTPSIQSIVLPDTPATPPRTLKTRVPVHGLL